MNRDSRLLLERLFQDRITAALGTLHNGAPFVSMVPYAVARDGSFVLHVSRLAAHTRDMIDNPAVSLLVSEFEVAGEMAQALARVTVQGKAKILERGSEQYVAAREVYLSRFADAAPLFEFSDFDLFVIEPVSARLIAGFGRAETLSGEALTAALTARP